MINGRESREVRGDVRVRSSALVRPCLGIFSFVPNGSFFPDLLLLYRYYFGVCFSLLFHILVYSYARYSVWDTHLVHGFHVPYPLNMNMLKMLENNLIGEKQPISAKLWVVYTYYFLILPVQDPYILRIL